VERALEHAGVGAGEVDFIHLHGTGTHANDASEAVALATVFDGPTPPAFGTKAQTGHTLGASGILESVLVIAALERACVPANAGLREPGIDPRLRLVRDPFAVPGARRALKVASGFGGVQQAVLFET
jgi:3-oxoacyl-(acyl-carrier-protein) synthase